MTYNIIPYDDFESASKDVLRLLHSRLGFGLWMVTRTEGSDWIVLTCEDNGYQVQRGDVFQWADSFCSQMVLGRGPRIAPRSADVPAYANAPIGGQVPIGAYIGVPLTLQDGSFFGTMCAIDPQPKPDEITDEEPLIEVLARLLTTVLETNLRIDAETRRAERAQAEAMIDSLTGIYNRRGWQELSSAEENRCRRYGHPACIFSIDIDGLKKINDQFGHASGDKLLQSAAGALSRATRQSDILARIGGDEFAILAVECNLPDGQIFAQRIQEELSASKISASIGFQYCRPEMTFEQSLIEADQKMYAEKLQRKQMASDAPNQCSG